MWLADQPDPDIRTVRPGRAAGGSDWIGLRRNEDYTVAGINQLPLLPGILVATGLPDGDRQRVVARGAVTSDSVTGPKLDPALWQRHFEANKR